MKKKALLTVAYAILILLGGIIGYLKAHSFPSLFMGSGFALLLLISAIGEFKNSALAFFSAIVLSGLLSFFFLWRFMQTKVFIPAGLLGIISVVVLITLIAMPNRFKK